MTEDSYGRCKVPAWLASRCKVPAWLASRC